VAQENRKAGYGHVDGNFHVRAVHHAPDGKQRHNTFGDVSQKRNYTGGFADYPGHISSPDVSAAFMLDIFPIPTMGYQDPCRHRPY
jgi:hypothetical protein